MTCKHETKNGRCGLKGCYAYKHTCYTHDCCKCWEPITNADRIRAMSDEELIDFFRSKEAFFLMYLSQEGIADWIDEPYKPALEEGQ